MKLPQLLYNKTDILILLCLHSSFYCPFQGAAVVGGHKMWPQRLETWCQYQHYAVRFWDLEGLTENLFFTGLSQIANETVHVKCV